jgi:aconitate hydratase A / 2-methylisocitrate dehydratase
MERPFDVVRALALPGGKSASYCSLPALEQAGAGAVSRLPVSLRIVLESLLRNCDGRRVRESDVRALAAWQPRAPRTEEVPFIVARVLLQDFTGVPLLVDLGAMRTAATKLGRDAKLIEPLVPVDLVIDHSVQVDYSGTDDAFERNLEMEFKRNRQRYEFLKWGMGAFDGLRIVPPGIGICHQVNLEFLARGVIERDGMLLPDTLVGTDSHTTMINGLGIVGYGVGGIEAEAGMLGQPVYSLMPDVVGVHLAGALRAGVTATDLVLSITEMLRKAKVVGKFVEFFGAGAASLAASERATIANMAPEYGATVGYFPVDEETCRYLAMTGRSQAQVATIEAYYQAQGLFGMPRPGDCDYSQVLELDLGSVVPSVAGPKRPQDRIPLDGLAAKFRELLTGAQPTGYTRPLEELGKRYPVRLDRPAPRVVAGGGVQEADVIPAGRLRNVSEQSEGEMVANRPTPDRVVAEATHTQLPATHVDCEVGHGDVVIAAITSCTNTSNPGVMLAAGVLAKKAVEAGLHTSPYTKTSLAPGSRVVTDYLERAGLTPYLDQLGFQLVGYGCTTCIGNSGPLEPHLEETITKHDLVTASVLSGNRNFEARVHQSVKANFLMSPPLVVAFAIAGRVDKDLVNEPIGTGTDGRPVFLKEIWPTAEEVRAVLGKAMDPESFRRLYADLGGTEQWAGIDAPRGVTYAWDAASTYIQHPPYFETEATPVGDIRGARALALFGDSITTDHISPAGAIKPTSPAGKYLIERGVSPADFNSYGARRGNHEVMVRGTFANVRIKNLMMKGQEGGVTLHQPAGQAMSIYDAAMAYQKEGVPQVVIAGHEYGTGSSRDWAAKGPRLLGVSAVIARSFERIHRSNLVGMGVLPCQLVDGTSAESLGLDGTESYDVVGLAGHKLEPRMGATLRVTRRDGQVVEVPLTVRIDTPIEVEYYQAGGILPYVLRQLVARA